MKSKFIYQIDGQYIFIRDIGDCNNKSVTNDIENVIDRISKELKENLDNFKILYQDSFGVVDAIKTEHGEFNDFIILHSDNFYSAKLKY